MYNLEGLFSEVDTTHLLKHLASENIDSFRHAAKIIDTRIQETVSENPATPIDPTISLLVLVYCADIDYSKKECDEVITTIRSYSTPNSTEKKEEGIAIHILQGEGFDLMQTARKCFYMTTFTPERIAFREQRRGAPNLSFYESIGRGAYHQLGHKELPQHFPSWREHFANKRLPQYKKDTPN